MVNQHYKVVFFFHFQVANVFKACAKLTCDSIAHLLQIYLCFESIGFICEVFPILTNEPRHEKTNILHKQKQKAQISFAVTVKLISAFVFATWIVQFLYFPNPKFPASSHLVQPCLRWTCSETTLLVFS